jgi:hypothetical protein
VLLPLIIFFAPIHFFVPIHAADTVRYVAPTASDTAGCSSWADACPLQKALTEATSGDQIWVQAGVHTPTTSPDPTIAFVVSSGVAVYGGFAGTETQRSQRDPSGNITVLSGDLERNDTVDASGVVTETSNITGTNSYQVVTTRGVTRTTVLDGVVITAGDAGGTGATDGGGMYNDNSSPTLIDVTFSGNRASSGGGMYNNQSAPTLTDVTFSENAAGSGGGMYNNQSNPMLTNIMFRDNRGDGGGMFNDNSSPILTDVTFRNNQDDFGGGMFNTNTSNPVLTNVTFVDNKANQYGGGMLNDFGSSPTLTNVIFSGNQSRSSQGGGMCNRSDSNPVLTNVIFSGNEALVGGGMVNGIDSTPVLTNVTFSGNHARSDGGGIYNFSTSSPTLTNVLLWGNTADDTGAQIFNSADSIPSISASTIQDSGGSGSGWDTGLGTDGGGNLASDPLFVDAAGVDAIVGTLDDDLRLQAGSPAIDAGLNSAIPAGVSTDLDGHPRISGGTVDMGAYEAQYPAAFRKRTPADATPDQPRSLTLSWEVSSGATGYAYCLDTTTNDTCDSNAWQSVSDTSAVVNELQAGTTYAWQVRAVNAIGTTQADGGTWYTFTTGVALTSTNGREGAPGSAFAFTAPGFPAAANVTVSVTPPESPGVRSAPAPASYRAGSVTADATGTVTFAVWFSQTARAGTYTVTASSGTVSASTVVTVNPSASVLDAPSGVPLVRGQPTVFLPLLQR